MDSTDQNQETRLRFRDRSVPRRYPHVCEALQTFTSDGTVNLEVGCGGKQYGPFVQGRHLGLDLQRGLYAGQGADTIGSAIHMPIRSASVDLVFMVATLLFMDEWRRPLEESCRVLKEGGRLVIFDYKPRTAVHLGYPGRFTPGDVVTKLRSHGVESREHSEFLPLYHIGPLRFTALRRQVSRAVYMAGRWIIVSGVKDTAVNKS